MEKPKRGTRFLHAFWLEPDKREPLLCEVTTVREGFVYWKTPGAKKAKYYFTIAEWPKYCKEVVEA